MVKLDEVLRQEIIQASKKQSPERFLRSKKYSIKDFKQVNFKQLFEQDTFTWITKVGKYTLAISFEGPFEELKQYVKSMRGPNRINRISEKLVASALSKALDTNDLYVNCSCLHPDTKIKLLSGESIPVSEMCERFNSGEQLYVYSVDDNGDFKPGVVEKVWETKKTSEFIEITLDNDETIITTPDHLYMLRSGEYLMASELKENMSLMPLYFNERKGYETVKFNSTSKYHSVYKEVAKFFKQDEIDKTQIIADEQNLKPYGVAIHHIDFNKSNNTPENLSIMTSRDHWEYHANCLNRLWDDPEWRAEQSKRASEHMKQVNANPSEKMIAARKEWNRKGVELNYTPERQAQQSEVMQKAITDWWANMTEEEYTEQCKKISERNLSPEVNEKLRESRAKFWNSLSEEEKEVYRKRGGINLNGEHGEKASKRVKSWWKNMDEETRKKECEKRSKLAKSAWERGCYNTEKFKSRKGFDFPRDEEFVRKSSYTKIRKTFLRILEAGETISEETFLKYRPSGCCHYKKYFSSIDEALKVLEVNHRVKSVKHITLDEEIPVYDIKVKDFNNFLVDAGVILHNCMDFKTRFAHHATVGGYKFGKPENRPNRFKKTNKDNNKGMVCKHLLAVLYGKRWVPFAARAWLRYMKQNPELTEAYLWDMDIKREKKLAKQARNTISNDSKEETEERA